MVEKNYKALRTHCYRNREEMVGGKISQVRTDYCSFLEIADPGCLSWIDQYQINREYVKQFIAR